MSSSSSCPIINFSLLRSWAAFWATAASALCAGALWYHATVVQEHEQTLNKVLEYAPNAVIVCNNQGNVVYANDAVKKITGFSEADLATGGVDQIIPDGLREAHRAAFQRALVKVTRGIEGMNYQRVMPVQCKDGSLIVCMVSVGTVNDIGGPHFFAFVMPVASAESPTPAQGAPSKSAPWRSPTLGPGAQFTDK